MNILNTNPPKETSDTKDKTKANSRLKDFLVFTKAWGTSPKQTGANVPSSRFLAKAIVSATHSNSDTKVIELGPGTGVFTKAILDSGIKPKNLTLIELNPEFRTLLKQRYPEVTILDEDAFGFLTNLAKNNPERIDYTIVSGLPLLVFPREVRLQMRTDILEVIGDTGRLVQFTYGPKSPIPLSDDIDAHCSSRIWLNFPPAVIWSYTRPKT